MERGKKEGNLIKYKALTDEGKKQASIGERNATDDRCFSSRTDQ